MPKLYVANATAQPHDFVVPLPEKGAMRIPIPAGQQVLVPIPETANNQTTINSIVDHHTKYGMVESKRAGDTKRNFVGLIYSLDKPVQHERIAVLVQRNMTVLEDRGVSLRRQAAISQHKALTEKGPAPRALEMTVAEDTKPGVDPSIDETTIVSTEAPEGAGPQPTQRRRRAA